METRTYKVYKFDELSDEAKGRAIDRLRDINVNDGWYSEDVINIWKEEIEKLGYNNVKAYYSGFCSQGDGACFECTIDLKTWLESHRAKSKFRNVWNSAIKNDMDYLLKFTHSGHYYHSGCMQITAEAYGYPDKAYSEFHDKLVDAIKEDARDHADDLYKRLEREYDYQTSDEAIIESINANDYDFTEDGALD